MIDPNPQAVGDERPSWLPDPSSLPETPAATESTPAGPAADAGGAAAGTPPDGYVARAEFERLQQELDTERGRYQSAFASATEAHRRAEMEGTIRQELERMYRDHTEAAQSAARMQPPQPEGMDDWLVDPQGIASYVSSYGTWMRDTLLGQLTPFLQRLALYDGVLPVVLGRAAEDSMSAARTALEAEGVTDFDELRPEIEAAFGANPAGARLILDPSTVASVYHYLARQRPVKPVKTASKTVPTAGRTTGKTENSPSPSLTPRLQEFAERLSINPAKLAQRLAARKKVA